ncbi:hypothetical protein PHSY_006880 [Pseudozyma hubeiensis SY62]|uniref:Uncharacterized protein n=1 Tax=Pseudozyma hubeiensis (strain SY62) TaxID=1305764 RepID=R9PD47_PSEHS|nr:hypothetical protein PHSY_006880 [Pseudozyma hubeiensis SY62]GAC99279.1 hypothetical protein PHSY_006880 [Pseudozyma hubeiensis SY62]
MCAPKSQNVAADATTSDDVGNAPELKGAGTGPERVRECWRCWWLVIVNSSNEVAKAVSETRKWSNTTQRCSSRNSRRDRSAPATKRLHTGNRLDRETRFLIFDST